MLPVPPQVTCATLQRCAAADWHTKRRRAVCPCLPVLVPALHLLPLTVRCRIHTDFRPPPILPPSRARAPLDLTAATRLGTPPTEPLSTPFARLVPPAARRFRTTGSAPRACLQAPCPPAQEVCASTRARCLSRGAPLRSAEIPRVLSWSSSFVRPHLTLRPRVVPQHCLEGTNACNSTLPCVQDFVTCSTGAAISSREPGVNPFNALPPNATQTTHSWFCPLVRAPSTCSLPVSSRWRCIVAWVGSHQQCHHPCPFLLRPGLSLRRSPCRERRAVLFSAR